MAVKTGLNNPSVERPHPYNVETVGKYNGRFDLTLTAGQSQICYLNKPNVFRPISVALSNGSELTVEISLDDHDTIYSTGDELGGSWYTVTNTNNNQFLSIASIVTAIRITNTGAGTNTAKVLP